MVAEQIFFRQTGAEQSSFVLVRLYREGGSAKAAAAVTPPASGGGEAADGFSLEGEIEPVLREATEYAMLKGYDLRIATENVEWPDALGSLIG